MPKSPLFVAKVLSPRTIAISCRETRKRLRVIEVSDDIESATVCSPYSSRTGRRMADAVWIRLKDNRTLVYNAKSGRRISEIADPCKDPVLQAELTQALAQWKSPIRYAVVFAGAKKSNGFYNFVTGRWEWNRIPDGAMFKDREVAEAAASILTKQRQQRGERSVIFPGKSKPLQTVAFRKTPKGFRFLEKIKSRHATYIPALPRSRASQPSPA